MINERTPLGIEGAPTTKISPVGIVILVVIIVLAVVAVYYYSPGLYEPEKEERQGITATFSDVYSEQTVDSEGDGRYDYLNISVGVNVSKYGEYSVDAYLHVGDNPLYSSSIQHLSAGNQTIVLPFNGLNIYLQRFNSSYQLRNLTLRVIKGNASFEMDYREYAYSTLFYNYTDFQNSVKLAYDGTIKGSCSDITLYSEYYTFTLKERVTKVWINLTSSKDVDLYLYNSTANITTGEGKIDESVTRDSGNEQIFIYESSTFEEFGYDKWTALVHNYSPYPKPLNEATYHITIDVVYE